tara:strand:- start:220 stop:378 length:159 start_codon:yes stop_codon:yes gene_type:complete
MECIAHSKYKVRCISSEAAPNRSWLAGNYYYYLHLLLKAFSAHARAIYMQEF